MVYPESYRYTKDDEWIEAKGELGTIGLTHEAQCRLGDIVFLELPSVGTALEAGKPLGVVESVKAVSDLYSPVSGEVTEINDVLATAPEKLNESPHGDGWLVKIRLSVPAEIPGLLSAADYSKFVAEEETGH